MMKALQAGLSSVVLVMAIHFSSAAGAEPSALALLGRSNVNGAYHVTLDERDWRWLRSKSVLLLGASAPDYASFDMVINNGQMEGVTVDYVQLIAQLLDIKIEVRRYDTRDQVLEALKNGEVDFVGTANEYEAQLPGVVLSRPYANDNPVLVSRRADSDKLPVDLKGKTIAMLYHYTSPEKVRSFYPGATLKLYPSMLTAIGAVAFGQADVYLGDSLSSSYLINNNFLNNIQVADFSRMEVHDFSFVMSEANQPLVHIINSALDAVPASARMEIMNRWGGDTESMPGKHRLNFSSKEQRWIDEHPTIPVYVRDGYPPLSFFNKNDEFVGIINDVLSKVSLRTGLKFDIQKKVTIADSIDAVVQNDAGLIAALAPSVERERLLNFTRPFLTSPYVLITSTNDNAPMSLEQMAGKRLALTRGNGMHEWLEKSAPTIHLIDADDADHAMRMIIAGEADAMASSMIISNYTVNYRYSGQLRTVSTISNDFMRMAFATNRGALELYSILDKTLSSISPKEMDEIANRWTNDVTIIDSYWTRSSKFIIEIIVATVLLLALALVWVAYMKLALRKRYEAERALNEQLEFMRVLIDGTPHPIYIRDRHGVMLICNASYLNVFGITRETVVGKTNVILLHPEDAVHYQEEFQCVIDIGLPIVKDREIRLLNERTLQIYHWMLPYRNSDGEVGGVIAGWIDISERQALIGQLREAKLAADEAKDDADDANRAKSLFLATMSHEIRTPMNAMSGFFCIKC